MRPFIGIICLLNNGHLFAFLYDLKELCRAPFVPLFASLFSIHKVINDYESHSHGTIIHEIPLPRVNVIRVKLSSSLKKFPFMLKSKNSQLFRIFNLRRIIRGSYLISVIFVSSTSS